MPISFTDLTTEVGDMLISISRASLEAILANEPPPKLPNNAILKEKTGVFCTLRKFGELRGCVGIPTPEFSLGVALLNASRSSALEDPRFPTVTKPELKSIDIEITVLTPPEVLRVKSPQEYFSLIEIGRDGLIASKGQYNRGLLLPQVPVEQNWSVEEFLNHTCMKAGIYPNDLWKNISDVQIERFNGKIFREELPKS